MATNLPESISRQVLQAQYVLEQHLKTIQTIHLFGSAVDDGLKPLSDIDLLVTVSAPLDDSTRHALMTSLLAVSAYPGTHHKRRALEVTVLDRENIVPWRYPTKRQMQFGEWLRDDINAGIFEPAMMDHDLAILLTKVRLHSIALYGPPAHEFFEEVPVSDMQRALLKTLTLWNTEADWEGDERNIVLTLVRIWYTAMTGDIASKEAAANWAIPYLPTSTKHIVIAARDGYLELNAIDLSNYPQERMELLHHIRSSVRTKLCSEAED